jgi:spermidine dehydrogenase
MEQEEERDPAHDRELGMDRDISRRDFLNGIAIGVGGILAGAWLPGLHGLPEFAQGASGPWWGPQDAPGYYPPALTGMRGSHPGSYDVGHAVRDGTFWSAAGQPVSTGEAYDLVVVGGGISGLAAARFYLARDPAARILILDNHDDFGGHAKRNEFRSRGRLLVTNGGTFAIDSPFPYSQQARGLLTELKIDPPALQAACLDRTLYRGLKSAVFFDRETFGSDRLAVGMPARGPTDEPLPAGVTWRTFLARTPLSPTAQRDIARIQEAKTDYMPGLSSDEKKDRLSRMSYRDFLLRVVKADPGVIPFYQTDTHDLYGVGIDAVPALDCWAIGFGGFQGLNLEPGPKGGRLSYTARGAAMEKEEYFFHFPDGNASIARLLVRKLVPAAVPGQTAEDIVTARVDYAKLDAAGSPVRIRLNSTVVRVRHAGDPASAREVEVTYGAAAAGGGANAYKAYTVRARGVVMAAWNMMIPYVCDELPEPQKEALRYGVKVPLVYTAVALRNSRAFHTLGVRQIACPGMYHAGVRLDIPVSIGNYRFPHDPDDPIVIRMLRTPCQPGLPARDQQRAGHADLLTTSFETFERKIRGQLSRMLGAGGFNAARDIEAITVNRWPHGYAYEYNPLWDPDWPPGQSPCEIGRQRFGRITIACEDAAAASYTDQAIDQAYRAVQELTATAS